MDVWNNPACSKCAAARETLDAARVPYRLRSYLDDPPTGEELAEVLRRLGAQPWDICRLHEPAAQRRGLPDWPPVEDAVRWWLGAMVASPEQLPRPMLRREHCGALDGHS